ncbi:MAG: hypothetical protein A2284_17625 [Deltaproteobacteria bacterium RIFOXYA12_FULL_61_11]|nr:MAG: hypothetical protein A2284_17625 [Deltaproteobacteria bacterium RIFOXYA12_FULL_61_11]
MLGSFRHEPVSDPTLSDTGAALRQALGLLEERRGREYPILLHDNEPILLAEKALAHDPTRPGEPLAIFQQCTAELLERAIGLGRAAMLPWATLPPERRSRLLLRLAGEMRTQRFVLAALLITEQGLTWQHALAEVAAAIDLVDFHGRAAVASSTRAADSHLDESELRHHPLGVVLLLPSWRDPLASLAHMLALTLVAGNTVCVIPAPEGRALTAEFVSMVRRLSSNPDPLVSCLSADLGTVGEVCSSAEAIFFTGERDRATRFHGLALDPLARPRYLYHHPTVGTQLLLELRGDLSVTIGNAVGQALHNNGTGLDQTVHLFTPRRLLGEVEAWVAETLRRLRLNPPASGESDLGPLPGREAFENFAAQFPKAPLQPPSGWFLAPQLVTGSLPSSVSTGLAGPALFLHPVEDHRDYADLVNTRFRDGLAIIRGADDEVCRDLAATLTNPRVVLHQPGLELRSSDRPQRDYLLTSANSNLGHDGPTALSHFLRRTRLETTSR